MEVEEEEEEEEEEEVEVVVEEESIRSYSRRVRYASSKR
jgi:hypothetical protein